MTEKSLQPRDQRFRYFGWRTKGLEKTTRWNALLFEYLWWQQITIHLGVPCETCKAIFSGGIRRQERWERLTSHVMNLKTTRIAEVDHLNPPTRSRGSPERTRAVFLPSRALPLSSPITVERRADCYEQARYERPGEVPHSFSEAIDIPELRVTWEDMLEMSWPTQKAMSIAIVNWFAARGKSMVFDPNVSTKRYSSFVREVTLPKVQNKGRTIGQPPKPKVPGKN